jgi:THO complex subunit 2
MLQRQLIKKQTALYYKQSKFNLLRESSEGFSALIVLLTSATALVSDAAMEEEDELKGRARTIWSRVMGLIGYFNLSPPRVLDVVLEIASCHITGHWRFFLELLRCSPWGKGAVEQGKGKGKERGEYTGEIERILQEGGDRVLAQVLGAKFGFAQVSDRFWSSGA